jgi:hypothetical protein
MVRISNERLDAGACMNMHDDTVRDSPVKGGEEVDNQGQPSTPSAGMDNLQNRATTNSTSAASASLPSQPGSEGQRDTIHEVSRSSSYSGCTRRAYSTPYMTSNLLRILPVFAV